MNIIFLYYINNIYIYKYILNLVLFNNVVSWKYEMKQQYFILLLNHISLINMHIVTWIHYCSIATPSCIWAVVAESYSIWCSVGCFDIILMSCWLSCRRVSCWRCIRPDLSLLQLYSVYLYCKWDEVVCWVSYISLMCLAINASDLLRAPPLSVTADTVPGIGRLGTTAHIFLKIFPMSRVHKPV